MVRNCSSSSSTFFFPAGVRTRSSAMSAMLLRKTKSPVTTGQHAPGPHRRVCQTAGLSRGLYQRPPGTTTEQAKPEVEPQSHRGHRGGEEKRKRSVTETGVWGTSFLEPRHGSPLLSLLFLSSVTSVTLWFNLRAGGGNR